MRRLIASYLLLPFALHAVESDALRHLPENAGILRDANGIRWHGLALTGTDAAQDVLVQVGARTVVVSRALVATDDVEAASALPALLSRAEAAGLDPTTLRLERGLLTGVHLRGEDALILAQVVLRRERIDAPDFTVLRNGLRQAATTLSAALDHTALTPVVRGVVARTLALLDRTAIGDDEVDPTLLRLLLRHGWLAQELQALPEFTALRTALDAALTLRPTVRWNGDNALLIDQLDAFDRRVVTFTSSEACARAQPHTTPSYGTAPPRVLVQHFPVGSDPLSADLPQSAEVWWGRMRLASWQAVSGFSADATAWRRVFTDQGPEAGDDTVVEWRPPHLVLSTVDGEISALCTRHGLLRPAVPGNHDDQERFLRDAARMCPDAPYLDLIGQYLFRYVHDSPDPQRPALVGVRGFTGEIHQTVAQTLASTCGGLLRGDCDDLSEVYHDLLTRQGQLPQIFSLPSHAACAWSIKRGDQWTTQVLHTGQPLAFHGDTLEDSLAQTFTHFDQRYSDRGTLVHVLLRFAGENTRSQWRLGSRIMCDGDYARTMIAVQRDWHFHTHAQGIGTMRRLIAEGDDASANWGELAGLYRRTGQWSLAIDAERESLKRLDDPQTRLDARLALIALLGRGGFKSEAGAEASDLLGSITRDFAAANQRPLRIRTTQQILTRLDPVEHRDLVRRILMQDLLPVMEMRRGELTTWARSRFDRRVWVSQVQEERRLANLLIDATLDGVEHDRTRALADGDMLKLLGFSENWLAHLAFLDTGEQDDVMAAYAVTGRLAGALLGETVLDALLDHAHDPAAWVPTHLPRTAGMGQLAHDLPWIRISVPYWSMRLSTVLGKKDTLLSEADALAVIARLRAAAAACERLDIDIAGVDQTLRWVALIEALVRRDEDALRAALRACAERRDRRSDELVTGNIEAMARHLPPAWFRRVLTLWDETAATKPGYFAIAWGCAVRGQIAQALEAGALAARRHGDDPTFVAEFTYLQQVLAGGDQP